MTVDPFTEIRYDELREHVAVIDAVVQATPGASRASIMRQMVAEWVAKKTHEATLVLNVERRFAAAPFPLRPCSGNEVAKP